MQKPLFTHRPPSTGVHLLSDPLPDFGARDYSRRTVENSAEPKHPRPARNKKSDS